MSSAPLTMMERMCSQCNLCEEWISPKEQTPTLAHFSEGRGDSLVLVVDDNPYHPNVKSAIKIVEGLIPPNVGFVYTTSIRCDFNSKGISESNREAILSRCSVWLGPLAEEKLVVISTLDGLSQLNVGGDRKIGDMFRSTRLGVVLVIPPVLFLKEGSSAWTTYSAKILRVLRESGLV